MDNPQLAELDASLSSLLRRAYDLGRSDALAKLVDAVNCNQSDGKALVLAGPDTAHSQNASSSNFIGSTPSNGTGSAYEPPWWVRPFV
jgi:hypothetical protein